MVRRPIVVVALIFHVACADPPTREIDQAQGAIEAARAAGADQYAEQEYGAAVTALERARVAVDARDYRLALNHALDARERAKESAKQAASQKAAVRSQAERQLAATTAALRAANNRLIAARSARVPSRDLARLREQMRAADETLQKARTALARDDYLGARSLLSTAAADIKTTAGRIDEAIRARGTRRRR